MFLLAHDKHAARVQSGKFCTLYPPTEECARAALERLSADLTGVSGPYVLTDRRYGDSECVSYRYGAFRGRTRVDAEGFGVHTMLGQDGEEVDDDRRPSFHLPAGVTDPFRAPGTTAAAGPVTLGGYTFEAVVQHSNAGGAYRFTTKDGTPVFAKEAKAHNGYTADGADAKARLTAEYLVLRAIHARAPGLCPAPVEVFHHWEHTYLVTERVPGMPLYRWMVTNNPAVTIAPDAEDLAAYHSRCTALLDQLDTQLRRLHELGYVFVDLSPTNVLVDDDDRVRLVDFEAVQRIDDVRRIMGTPGYQHPDPRAAAERDPRELDRYGLSALALLLVFPLHEVVERAPAVLEHLHATLSELAPVPPRLWQWATRVHDRVAATPTPADALVAMARPAHPAWVYPTSPLGHQTDTRAPAAGTAGVLYALHRAGRPADPVIVARLREEALRAAETCAPGLLYGTAGVAGVLAVLGEGEAADTLFAAAARHPLNDTSATLLRHHRRTGDQRWLDLAHRLLDRLPADLTPRLGRTTRSGLVAGRPGVALALYDLYRATGDERHFDRGMALLREELAFAQPLPVGGLGFKTAQADRRVYPYLFAGSAGYAAVLSRYHAHRPDDLGEVLEQCLRACTIRFAVFPGLFPGLAGLAVTLADAGTRLGRPDLHTTALDSARGLFRYPVPHAGGVGWLGEPGQRLSADLWSGSAGILLALVRLTATAGPTTGEGSEQHGGSPAFAG
jgi:tRNA A-37 threonylcarbamoyl transferase component Bud32